MEIRQTEIIIIQGSFRSQTSNQSATKTSPYYFKKEYKMEKEEIKNLLYALHHSTYRNEQQIKTVRIAVAMWKMWGYYRLYIIIKGYNE